MPPNFLPIALIKQFNKLLFKKSKNLCASFRVRRDRGFFVCLVVIVLLLLLLWLLLHGCCCFVMCSFVFVFWVGLGWGCYLCIDTSFLLFFFLLLKKNRYFVVTFHSTPYNCLTQACTGNLRAGTERVKPVQLDLTDACCPFRQAGHAPFAISFQTWRKPKGTSATFDE